MWNDCRSIISQILLAVVVRYRQYNQADGNSRVMRKKRKRGQSKKQKTADRTAKIHPRTSSAWSDNSKTEAKTASPQLVRMVFSQQYGSFNWLCVFALEKIIDEARETQHHQSAKNYGDCQRPSSSLVNFANCTVITRKINSRIENVHNCFN